MAVISGFPHILSTSVPIGQPQKQLSVPLNFPNEKSPPAMQPVNKILCPLVRFVTAQSKYAWFADTPRLVPTVSGV